MSGVLQRVEVQAELPMDYLLRQPASGAAARELILLLHGFGESGSSIFKHLEEAMPEDAQVLAPNALFPFWEKPRRESRLGYSWYIYDFKTDEYVIDMKPAVSFLSRAIDRLGLSSLPLRIVGFSQGGYLAPFLAERLPRSRQVIGIHSTYLHEELSPTLSFRTDNIVGELDTIVEPEISRRAHAEVVRRSRGGEFICLPKIGHEIGAAAVRKTAELLQRNEA